MNNNDVKVIAFYLPQFHTIPENDKAHGIGFTEWTNTKKAKPLFDEHYQPRTPLNNNYYCLLDKGVMQQQAELAKQYGIYGFCYYHYWFKNGKKLLEKPLEKMLNDPSIDIPFCLCWANENWSKRWDGGNNEIIVEQDYGDTKDLEKHIDYLCNFFRDPRYIKEKGLPILVLYKPEIIPNLKKMIRIIRERVKENGFPGVKIIVQYPKFYFNGANLNLFDGYIQFEPKFIQDSIVDGQRSRSKKVIKKALLSMGLTNFVEYVEETLTKRHTEGKVLALTMRDYDQDWEAILKYPVNDSKLIAGAFNDWDNTARNKKGLMYRGANPQKFGRYMKQLVSKVQNEYSSSFIFINAWNEWAEGAYLEPDERYQYAYLEALRDALGWK